MRYDHEIWDVMMKLFEFAEKQLEKHGPGIMLADLRKQHEEAMTSFTLHRDQVASFLQYFSGSDHMNPLPGLDRLNDAEVEATRGTIKASSTQAGRKAVKEAQKRLDERKRMAPVAEAQEKLREAEKLREEKELKVKVDKEKRDRPRWELEEARRAEEAAEAEVKEAEEAVKKAKL